MKEGQECNALNNLRTIPCMIPRLPAELFEIVTEHGIILNREEMMVPQKVIKGDG